MKKSLKFLVVSFLITTFLSSCTLSSKPLNTISTLDQAYHVALDNGFNGSYEEFVALVKGDKGDSGLSAYELYKKYHPEYKKTEEQWIKEFFDIDTCPQHIVDNAKLKDLYLKRNNNIVFYAYDSPCLSCGKVVTSADTSRQVYINKNFVEYRVFDEFYDADFINSNSNQPYSMKEYPSNIIEHNNRYYKFKSWDKQISSVKSDYVVNAVFEEVEKPKDYKITVWCDPDDVEFVNQVADNFKNEPRYQKFANAQINVVANSIVDVSSKLSIDLAASADVFHYFREDLSNFVESQFLYAIPKPVVNGIGIETNILKYGQIKGEQYGIPYTPNTYFMYYDASVYTEDEVKSFSKMMNKDLSLTGYDYNFGMDLTNGWYAQSYYFSNGCTIFGPDGNQAEKGIEPKEKGYHVANWMWELLNGQYSNRFNRNGSYSETGRTLAATVAGTWASDIIKQNIEENGGVYAAAPLPKVDFGDGEVVWKALGDYYEIGVKSITENSELSCMFASYLANKESQKLRYVMRKTAPTNLELYNDPTLVLDAAVVALGKQLANQFSQPTIYNEQNWWDKCIKLGSDLSSCTKSQVKDYFNNFLEKITIVRP